MFDSQLSALFVDEAPVVDRPQALSDEEARHVRALRLGEGNEVLLLDGKGARSVARIERIERRGVLVRPVSVTFEGVGAGPYIVLSFGLLADKTRIEWCVEKSTELGVAEMIPIETERSEGFLHRSRLERIARAALKQSQRSWLPRIAEPLPLGTLAAAARDFDRAYLCHESAPLDRSLAARLLADRPVGRVLILIGPEGGFTEEEVDIMREAAEIVSLGETRLRAETAAIAAVALVRSIAGGAGR